MEKTKAPKTTKNPLKTIRGKLAILSVVSIVSTVILGFTGIRIMNSNNDNNQILANMNNINLLQNENQTQTVNFLYYLDVSYYQKILQNLKEMQQYADDSLSHNVASFNEDLTSISQIINESCDNTSQLVELLSNRGFSEADGMYASFFASDAGLADAFAEFAKESDWVDNPWNEVHLSACEVVNIDGKDYIHVPVSIELKDLSKRDNIVCRVGGSGVGYTGNYYITNLKFDGSNDYDFTTITEEELKKSYGDALKSFGVSTFNGSSAIAVSAGFDAENPNWQEISIELPIRTYPLQDYKKISYDLYFEPVATPMFNVATAFNVKYEYEATLEELNELFKNYSKLVAEGNDANSVATEIQALFAEFIENIPLYTTNKSVAETAVGLAQAKSDAFTKANDYDQNILALRAENVTLNDQLSQVTSDVRSLVESVTESSKASMTMIILIVFIIGAALVIVISVFTIISIQKSVDAFRNTLTLISDGDMTVKAKTGSGDEFDIFGQTLNHMTDRLNDTLSSVVNIAEEVKLSGASLQEMSELTSQTSSQIDVSVAGISQGATSQANDVEQSTIQISDLGDLMETMVGNVGELDQNSLEMKQASDDAATILNELSISNEKMTDGIHRISKQINTTNDSVQKIADAVSLISSIADQTNLLSLNASIEAARAGEAGKGFAVVASEIQQLADQSNQSANTIYEVITNLTSDFKTTLSVMDEVESATAEQNNKLSETQHHFDIVKNGISESREKTASIKDSIESCDSLRQNISQIMVNLSAISEENAASATETSDAMQNLNQTIAQQLEESNKLQQISEKLESDMQFFTL